MQGTRFQGTPPYANNELHLRPQLPVMGTRRAPTTAARVPEGILRPSAAGSRDIPSVTQDGGAHVAARVPSREAEVRTGLRPAPGLPISSRKKGKSLGMPMEGRGPIPEEAARLRGRPGRGRLAAGPGSGVATCRHGRPAAAGAASWG